MPYYTRQATDSVKFLSNYQRHFLIELEEKSFKICVETKKLLNSKIILRKKNETGGIMLPDFRLYYKATVIKAVC